MRWRDISGSAKAATVFALLGFVLSMAFTKTRSTNSVMTYCLSIDIGAILLGVIALIVGWTGARQAHQSKSTLNLLICGIAALVGAYHVARGAGIISNACPGMLF